MFKMRWFFYVMVLVLLSIGCRECGRIGTRVTKRQDISYGADDYSKKEEDEMYPTSHVRPDDAKNDDVTMDLVNSLASKGGDKEEEENDDEFQLNKDYVGDDKYKGDENEDGGDNSDGIDDNEKKSRSTSALHNNSEMKMLEEYRKYPNEAVENEFVQSENKKVPIISDFKDAYSQDSDIISKELKALDEEDRLIGDVKTSGNVLANINRKEAAKQTLERYSNDDPDPEMEKITKELLNMKVGANGIILPDNDKPRKPSRESILPTMSQLKWNDEFTPVALMTNGTANKMNQSTDVADTANLIKQVSSGKSLTLTKSDDRAGLKNDKADLLSFYNSRNTNQQRKTTRKNFSKMQNELLHEMFKMRTSSIHKKSLQAPTGSRQIFMSDKDLDTFQSMRRKKKKKKRRKKKRGTISRMYKRNSINRIKNVKRSDMSHSEGFTGDTENDVEDDEDAYINKWRAASIHTGSKSHLNKDLNKRTETSNADSGKQLRIQIKSVGCFDPPFYGSHCSETVGSISVNGVELSKNQPGFNFVILDMETGAMENTVNFDTQGQAGADEKMEDFINGLPLWKIVCVAVKDDGKTYLSESALDIFKKIGASQIVRRKLDIRASYAFVGVSGPSIAWNRIGWIREEVSRSGNGPSIINVLAETGPAFVQQLKDDLHLSSHILAPTRPLVEEPAANQQQQKLVEQLQSKDVQQMQRKPSNKTMDSTKSGDHEHTLILKNSNQQGLPSTTLVPSTTLFTTTQPPTTTTTVRPTTTTTPLTTTQLMESASSRFLALGDPNLLNKNVDQINENYPSAPEIGGPIESPAEQVSPLADTASLLNNLNLNSLKPFQIANLIQNPSDSLTNLIEAAKSFNNQAESTGNKKSTQNSKPAESQFLQKILENVNQLKSQLQQQLLVKNSTLTAPSPDLSQNSDTAEGRSVNSNDEEESETRSPAPPSTMEAAADAAGSRNVGESRLASALSALGLPDAGATGISSLLAAGFIAAGDFKKKEAALKLGLAAKLSKSIADLGGRGAASAAGIASLSELLKDSRDMSTTRIADQIGQALQRVGGAGAAVGYAALAASLKAVGDKPRPGALVGGIILALAEQGAAPGTAGLAALAAGLGGSGADALAGGLGGSLPNIITAAKTNNFMAGGDGGGGGGFGGGFAGRNELSLTGSDPNAALVGGGDNQFHTDNIDAEYTGQGPIGSSTQSGGMGGGVGDVVGSCRSLKCQVKARNDVTSSTHSEGALLPTLIGGGELVSTDDSIESQCSIKNTVPQKCNEVCKDKKVLLSRILDAKSTDKKASIKINGEEYSKDEDGINVVVVDYNSGQIESSEVFDTTQEPGSAKALVNFLRSLGDKKIIVGATKGNVGQYMFNDVYQTLGDIGLKRLLNNAPIGHLTKYVFLTSKGDVLPNSKEEASQDTAELFAPIVVGPGALKDVCSCLKKCSLFSRGDSEKAYADLGDGTNIAGRAGTKRGKLMYAHRVVVPKKKHSTQITKNTLMESQPAVNLLSKTRIIQLESKKTKEGSPSNQTLHGKEKEDSKKGVVKAEAISSLNNSFESMEAAIQRSKMKEDEEEKGKRKNDSLSEKGNVYDDIYSSIGSSLYQR